MANKTQSAEAQAQDAAQQSQTISQALESGGKPAVVWDDSNMRTTYANVVNGTSTQEEVSLFFGANQTWNLSQETELKVILSDRIILTPLAARRLWLLLGAILKAYESRFGPLDADKARGAKPQ